MKIQSGSWVRYFDRKGIVENVSADGLYAAVRFPREDFPFPEMNVLRIKELKLSKAPVIEHEYQVAPF
jgi:hypothetical protein